MFALLFFMASAVFPAGGLGPRIEFWKAVFVQYGEDDLIFHDTKHVHLVYDVASLSKEGVARDDRLGRIRIEDDLRIKIAIGLNEMNLRRPAEWSAFTRLLASKVSASGVTDSPSELAGRIHIQRGIRERFADGLKRYTNYRGTIEPILLREGVPLELAALPLVESAYMNTALSKTGAAGIWQFMPGTARMYMKVNAAVDQRMDVVIATQSAARLLRSNYAALGSWPLAISAYNHGLAGIKRARQQCGNSLPGIIDCYRGASFGYASANFYSEFLAALDLLNDYRKHHAPNSTETYRVRRGDTLIKLSQKFGTTLQQLMALNGIKDPDRLAAGIVIVVPKV